MSSYKDLYTQAIDDSIRTILDLISSYYASEHGVEVPADELMDLIGARVVKTSPATKTAAKTTTKAGATKTTAKTAAAKPDKERRRKEQGQLKGLCLYVLTRGNNQGTYCTVRAVKGKNVCSSCDRKKGELGFYADDDGEEEVDSGRAPGKFTGAVPDDDDEPPALTVVQYGESNLIYVSDEGSPVLLLVLNPADENTGEESYTVIGQLDAKGKIIPLNKVGLKRANLMKLDVDSDLLNKLAEQGVIDYTPPEQNGDEVDSVPGMNVDDKPAASKKPNVPRKAPPAVAKPPPARRPVAQRTARATVEVDDEEEE